LEHEIIRKPVNVPLHGLHENLGLNPVQLRQILVEQDLLAAYQQNRSLDLRRRNDTLPL